MSSLTPLLTGLARFEQHPAIVALSPEGPAIQTYAELARRVEALAGGLVETGLARGATAALALSAAAIRQGDSLAWFPEGQRAPDGRLHDFRAGIGRLLARFPLRVIPVRIAGSFDAMPTGRRWPRRVPIVIRFGAPIDPRTLVPDLRAADAPGRIASALQSVVSELGARRSGGRCA